MSGSVDLTVTSPPYDNLRTYNGSLNDWTPEKWQAIIAELYRVTADGGVVVWVVGDATVNGSETGTSFRQALWAMECGFRLHDTMLFEKTAVLPTQDRYCNVFEYMFVLSKGRPSRMNFLCDRPNRKAGQREFKDAVINKENPQRSTGAQYVTAAFGRRSNIWRIHTGQNGDDRVNHPAKFPEALARDHIISWSNEGDTVLDPFMGSGTTGKMALLSGRKFIGIERDPAYFDIAKGRLRLLPEWQEADGEPGCYEPTGDIQARQTEAWNKRPDDLVRDALAMVRPAT